MAQAARLRRDKPKHYLTLESDAPLGQRLNIYEGVPLIARVSATHDGMHNSLLLDVLSFIGETITVTAKEGD